MSFCEKFKKDFEQVGCGTFIVPKDYRTPATDYPLDRLGSARLTRGKYEKEAVKLMEGVRGYDFYVWGTNNQMLNPAVEKQPCEAADRIKGEMHRRRGTF